MNLAKQLAEQARESGSVRDTVEFFTVTDKQTVDLANGGTTTVDVPNGVHKVRILSEKLGKGKSYNGKEQDELQMEILDNGKKKLWHVPTKNEDGTLYYLIEDLESIELNEEFTVEAVKMKNGKYAKRITKAAHPRHHATDSTDDIPVISLDEDISSEEVPL